MDDYHFVDDSPDIRPIMREVLTRAPERLTLVFASRRVPAIPIARLRAQGEVAELRTADLRFDELETERLFREAYAMPLDPSVAGELARRTEGWVASLQLVQSAIRGRTSSEIRTFIRSLTGAEGDLYDYLAEEVVGELPDELQQFLMRTAVLETVEPELGAVAGGIETDAARRLIEDGERVGLLARRGSVGRHVVRAHPLVRDFLLARLNRAIGPGGLRTIHRRVAQAAEPFDWALAGHHYLASGDAGDVRRVLRASIDAILSSGAYRTAGPLLDAFDGTDPDAVALVIQSRQALQRGDTDAAVDLADRAHALEPGSDFALVNALSTRFSCGHFEAALALTSALGANPSPFALSVARSVTRMLDSSLAGRLTDAIGALNDVLREAPDGPSGLHYRGVSQLNIAHFMKARGEALVSLALADEAIANLEATSAGIELVSARLIRGWSLAHLARLAEARLETASARATATRTLEAQSESAEIELMYGDVESARSLLAGIDDGSTEEGPDGDLARTGRALLALRDHDPAAALGIAKTFRFGQPSTTVAMEARRLAVRTHAEIASRSESGLDWLDRSIELSQRQGAHFWHRYLRLLRGIAGTTSDLAGALSAVCSIDPSFASVLADDLSNRLGDLEDDLYAQVQVEAVRRPERWRSALRFALRERPALRAARLLEIVGTREDVALLRSIARSPKLGRRAPDLGKELARRVAERVWIEDLGRVEIQIGDVRTEGTDLRRKVLALLCFLLTKTRFAATREEVLDALWPNLEPDVALNSLNQTVYFLRRVFEPEYREELSPGYVEQDTETVWLDRDLIGARSDTCRRLLRTMPADPEPEQVWDLVSSYHGRFALDFAYEDWASSTRDSLHAAYLRVVETAVKSDLQRGQFARGIAVAEHVLDVEPDSEEIQAALLRLYRLSGVHAAAAEQYSHYSETLRELGVDPPAIDSV
jgi:DNA-binding SARP family transcriptional activator